MSDIKLTPAQQKIYTGFRENLEGQKTALTKMKEKAGATAVATEIQSLIDGLNTQLTALPPLDQVPLAMEAAGALNWMLDAISRTQEYANSLMVKLQNLGETLNTKMGELSALNTKIENKDLLPKETVTEACNTAKQAGIDSCKDEILASRKKAVELAGLTEATPELLAKPMKEFNEAVEQAKANLTIAGKSGMKLGGKGDGFLKKFLWSKTTEFNSELDTVREFAGQKKTGVNPGAGGALETEPEKTPGPGVGHARPGLA